MHYSLFGSQLNKNCCRPYDNCENGNDHYCFCSYVACFDNTLVMLKILPYNKGWMGCSRQAGTTDLCKELSECEI